MAYVSSDTAWGTSVAVTGTTREEMFRDVVRAVLEAAYAGEPKEGVNDGQVLPVQAVGEDDGKTVADLVANCLAAISEAPGTLHAPRWMGFDDNRVTATLPMTSPKATVHPLHLRRAPTESGGNSSFATTLELERPRH